MTPYYEDESVTLYHGDCIEVMSEVGDATVDSVLTDPPYSSGGRRENARSIRKSMTRAVEDDDWIRGDAMSTDAFTWFMRACGLELRRLLMNGGHLLSFIDWRMCNALVTALGTADLQQNSLIVWDKGRIGMGSTFRNQHELIVHCSAGNPRAPQRRDVANVLTFPPVRDGDHPTEKPEPLLRTLLSVVCPPGGTVLDPFAGSGSTLGAAASLGMKAIGVESDERWCESIAKRFAQGDLFGGAA